MKYRNETRRQRHANKHAVAKTFNFIPVCINFQHEENVAFIIRSAACFGAKAVAVIGALPTDHRLRTLSGTLNNEIEILQFANTNKFLEAVRNEQSFLVSLELTDKAKNIHDFCFPMNKTVYLLAGHETIGVPAEILHCSDEVVYIPMPGVGHCLNTSQTANIAMFEYMRQRAK